MSDWWTSMLPTLLEEKWTKSVRQRIEYSLLITNHQFLPFQVWNWRHKSTRVFHQRCTSAAELNYKDHSFQTSNIVLSINTIRNPQLQLIAPESFVQHAVASSSQLNANPNADFSHYLRNGIIIHFAFHTCDESVCFESLYQPLGQLAVDKVLRHGGLWQID